MHIEGMRNLRAAAVQFEHVNGDKASNLATIRRFAERAADMGTEVLVFPECCISGYWFLRHLNPGQLMDLAEDREGPAAQTLMELASRLGMLIGAGLVEKDEAGRMFNGYFVATPDGRLVSHRKLHTFVSPHLRSGDHLTVLDCFDTRFAVLTCYDNNIVENVRLCALAGAEVLLAPHQTGGCRSSNPHTMGLVDRGAWDRRGEDPEAIEAELKGPKGRAWLMRWLPSRAHDNGIFLVFSNGVGVDDDEVRTGNCAIFDPYGRILAETWKAGDDMVTADLDASLLEQSTGRRWIRTRRPELYGPLAVRTGLEEDVRVVRFDAKGI